MHKFILKVNGIYQLATSLTAMGSRVPWGSHCNLPPSRGNIPALTPAEAGTRLSDPRRMQGWVDLVGWLPTETAYPPEVGHPSLYWPEPTWVNFFHAMNTANHYTTQPTIHYVGWHTSSWTILSAKINDFLLSKNYKFAIIIKGVCWNAVFEISVISVI